MKNLDRHEYSDLYPEMEESQFQSFLDDINKNGYTDPTVYLFEGKVLDGWHRYQAALTLDESYLTNRIGELDFQEYKGVDPLAFVHSRNGHRRHLTQAQLAVIALKHTKTLKKGNVKAQKDSDTQDCIPKSNADIAKDAGTSERTVNNAKKAMSIAPDKVDDMIAGDVTPTEIIRDAKQNDNDAKPVEKPDNTPIQNYDDDDEDEYIDKYSEEEYGDGRVFLYNDISTSSESYEFENPDDADCFADDLRKTADDLNQLSARRRYGVYGREGKLLYPDLPDKKYDIIYADPPWDYQGQKQHNGEGGVDTGGASTHYPTLTLPELRMLDIESISNENCLLFLWTTGPHLDQAIHLGTIWGFEYKQIAFVWDKQKTNPGAYTLTQCEHVLVFKKGKRPDDRLATPRQLVSEERTKHSKKPQEIRDRIYMMYPDATRIELFARDEDDNWDAWGNEVM